VTDVPQNSVAITGLPLWEPVKAVTLI
jgi:hypothetical protein